MFDFISKKPVAADCVWCSWCFHKSKHDLVEQNVVRRSVYSCCACKRRTLPCRTESCEAFARGTKFWDEDHCALCQGRLVKWEENNSRTSKLAWCSWCLEQTNHYLFEKNLLFRDVYECELCNKLGVECRMCRHAFARKHSDWADEHCSVCVGMIPSWGVKKLATDNRIKRWCSECVEETHHEIEEKNFFLRDTFRCSNCHSLTMPCRLCEEACTVVVPASNTDEIQIPISQFTSQIPNPIDDKTLCLRCKTRDVAGNPTSNWLSLKTKREIKMMVLLEQQNEATTTRLQTEETALVQKLYEISDSMTFPKDSVIIPEGSVDRKLIIIQRGTRTARVEKDFSGTGRPVTVAKLGSQEAIGEITFLTGGSATATVKAHSEMVLVATLTPEGLNAKIDSKEISESVFYRYLSLKLASRLKKVNASKKQGGTPTPIQQKIWSLEDLTKLFRDKIVNVPAAETPIMGEQCLMTTYGHRTVHGTLFVCRSIVAVFATIFAEEYKFVMHYSTISNIKEESKLLISFDCSLPDIQHVTIEFDDEDSCATAMSALSACAESKELWQDAGLFEAAMEPHDESQGMRSIIKGARCLEFLKDDVILHEGNADHKLYQIAKGSVRVEKGVGLDHVHLANLPAGAIVGEISYLERGVAGASIIADCDGVQVHVLDAKFIDDLIQENSQVAGLFHKYLANLLAQRLRAAMSTS